jgi:hypothetical protein
MALYRLEVQGIQRAQGRSAVAAAAYRAGAALHDQRLEMAFDYTARGGVEHTEIAAPEGAPAALLDRQSLWNAAELADKRSDSRPARELLLALPHELNAEQRLALVRAFVAEHVVAHGMIADIALHGPDKAGDQRNHHAHILVTTRAVTDDGFGRKVEAWTKPELVRQWRSGWAQVQNEHLQRALGRDAPQVTNKSLADQGVERDPTIHLGPAASGMERRGERSDRGDINRAIHDAAGERETLQRDLGQTEDEVVAKAAPGARGTQALADEFAALHGDLLREHGRLAQAREAIVVSGARRAPDVAQEVLHPARRERLAAKARLDRVEGRVEQVRNRRNTLARWLTNPGRMIWAKHAELNAIASARAAYRLASARLTARQAWLRSEAGLVYVAKHVEPGGLSAQDAYRQKRTLERRMKRIAKRAEAVENVRVKALIARELGHHTLEAPSKTVGVTQLVRAMDASTLAAIREHAPDAQRRAYDRVTLQLRSRARGPIPEL